MRAAPPWLRPPTLPAHCAPVSPLHEAVSAYTHTCVPTTPALLSSLLGSLSIVTWLFAQLPQVWENYRLGSTAGLSVYFLVVWCAGDSTNLVGALMTGQAGWQVMLAAYYTCVDITLVFQYWWYTHAKPRRILRKAGAAGGMQYGGGQGGGDGRGLAVIDGVPVAGRCRDEMTEAHLPDGATKAAAHLGRQPIPISSRSISSSMSSSLSKLLLASSLAAGARAAPILNHRSAAPPPSPTHSLQHAIGLAVSWSSTCLYLGSRLPQLLKNYRRKSTTGLSPLLFACAFTGNVFYSASLLANPQAWRDLPPHGERGWVGERGSDRAAWLASATPFFLGAAGVLLLDATVGVQFLLYREKTTELLVQVDELATDDGGDSDYESGGEGGGQCRHGGSDDGSLDPDAVDKHSEHHKHQHHHHRHSKGRWVKLSGWMRGWYPSSSLGRSDDSLERQLLLASQRQPPGTYQSAD
ncbi:hypothetical protein KEM52_000422 [Ascosphaera acerosa]|nr:hypothetical protein KEM52_000422 [Ascosphaera acerosa]